MDQLNPTKHEQISAILITSYSVNCSKQYNYIYAYSFYELICAPHFFYVLSI